MSVPDDARVPLLVGIAIAFIILSDLAVCVRFWSRVVTPELRIWWDDWAILATLVFANLNGGFIIWSTDYGLGQHIMEVPKSDLTMSNIIQLTTLIWYSTATNLLKISALVFYARIFHVSRPYRAVLWVAGVAVTIWWILLVVLPFTHCNPPKKAFFPLTKGHCSGGGTPWYLGSSITNVMLDLIVLVLPIPMIWRLQLKLGRKIQLSLVFLLGYSSAFVGLARFSIVASNPSILNDQTDKDLTYNLVPLLILSMIEPPLGIIALCGPSIRQQIIRSASYDFASLWSTQGSHRRLIDSSSDPTGTGASVTHNSTRSENQSRTGFSKVLDAQHQSGTSNSSAVGSHERSKDGIPQGTEIPMNYIMVTGENQV